MTEVNLSELQKRLSAYLDQSATAATAGSADWNLRLEFINRRQEQWARTYDWEALRQEVKFNVTGVTQASLALPVDFNRLGSEVVFWSTGITTGETYPVVKRDEIRLYTSTDRYCYVGGNRNNGFYLTVNPGTVASGASITASYYSIATSLASPANVSPIPDPEYLVQGTIADILESRSDERFPIAQQKAEQALMTMVENENVPNVGQVNTTMNSERRQGFRLGRN